MQKNPSCYCLSDVSVDVDLVLFDCLVCCQKQYLFDSLWEAVKYTRLGLSLQIEFWH